jgi:hypothetical protein
LAAGAKSLIFCAEFLWDVHNCAEYVRDGSDAIFLILILNQIKDEIKSKIKIKSKKNA